MKKTVLSLLVCALLSSSLAAHETPVRTDLQLPNLGLVRNAVKAYVKSGQYQQEFDQVVAQAKAYLEANLPTLKGQKAALVLDIDETSISNMPYMEANDFGYIPAPWEAWITEGDAQPFASTLDLYQTARANGVDVFFVTARPETDRAATVKLLQRAGYTEVAELFLKPVDDTSSSALYKASRRRQIVEKGYRVLVNLGDQFTDLEGGYAEGAFKLPNPMYFVP